MTMRQDILINWQTCWLIQRQYKFKSVLLNKNLFNLELRRFFLIEKEEGKRAGKNKVKKRSEKEWSFIIRNYIAHFNYIPDAEKSILEILEELRELLKYDRKLKNAVMKSVKDIFKEYGFIVEFRISHESNSKKIKVLDVKSEKIKHLKNNGLVTTKNSEDLCELVKVMLEYKKS